MRLEHQMLLPCKYHHELNLQQPLSIFLFPTEYMLCCCAKYFSCVLLFVTLGTTAHQAPLSMGFSRQEYWSGLPFPSPRHLPRPGIEPESLKSPALAGEFFTPKNLHIYLKMGIAMLLCSQSSLHQSEFLKRVS